MKAMFCPNCGGPVGDKAKFCSHCGASLTQPEPEPAAQPAPSVPSDPPELFPKTQLPPQDSPDSSSEAPQSPSAPEDASTPGDLDQSAGPVPQPEEDSPFSDLLRHQSAPGPSAGFAPPAEDAPPMGFYGGPAGPDSPPPPPPDMPEEVQPPHRKKRVGLAVGIAAAVVLVAAGTLAAFLLFFNTSPKAQLAAYMGNTWAAMAPGGGEDGFFAALAACEGKASRQTWNIRLGDDLTALLLEGGTDTFLGTNASLSLTPEELSDSGITLVSEQDLANRKLSMSMSGNLGGFQVDALRLFLDDSLLSVSSPDFLGEQFYAINTETLAADLSASPLGEGVTADESMNFNYFDLLTPETDGALDQLLSPDTLSALRELYETWQDSVTVEKGSAGSVVVNGAPLTCTPYTMTIPAPSLRDFITDGFALLEADEAFRVWLAQAMINGEYGSLSDMDPEAYWQENRQDVYDTLDSLSAVFQDDLVLVFQVADEQVRQITGNTRLTSAYGDALSFSLDVQFGSESGVAGAFSAFLTVDDGYTPVRLELVSSGNHIPQAGEAFTDATRFSVFETGAEVFSLTADTWYDSIQPTDNFSFSCLISDEYGSTAMLNLSGTVQYDVQACAASVDLDTISLGSGAQQFTLAGSWSVEPLDSFSFQPDSPTMLLSMSQAELDALSPLAGERLAALEERFYEYFPEAYVEPFDAGDFMTGLLDNTYRGILDHEYLEHSGYTQEEALAIHQSKLDTEPEYFFTAFGIEYPTEALQTRFATLYAQLYVQARYEIAGVEQLDSETYVVTVAVEPMDAIQQMYDRFPAFSEAFEAQFDEAALAAMSQEEWDDWYVNVYDAQYGQGLADLFETVLTEGVGYGETEYVEVYVTRNYDGTWSADENSLWDLDLAILPY